MPRAVDEPAQQVIDITMEQRQGADWKPVSAQKVFHAKDDIRFRLKSRIPGYLYVLNHESGGDRNWLYPRPKQEDSNQIEVDKTYVIPDAKGSFIVGGEPGFDITYWMIAPTALDIAGAGEPTNTKPSTLLPRCQERLLRARGVCEDQQAGPHAVGDSTEIPPLFTNSGGLVSRDLKFQTGSPAFVSRHLSRNPGALFMHCGIAHK